MEQSTTYNATATGPSDEELMARVKAGDDGALALLVRRYEQPLFHHARHMLGYALIGQGKEHYAEGLELLLVGFRGMKQERTGIPPFHKSRLGEAALRIREIYAHRGEIHKVDEWTATFNSLDEEEKKVLIARPGK